MSIDQSGHVFSEVNPHTQVQTETAIELEPTEEFRARLNAILTDMVRKLESPSGQVLSPQEIHPNADSQTQNSFHKGE